jgi:tetratricopeptide (TPR) repeat protein
MRSLMHRPLDQDTALNLLEALEALNGEISEAERAALRQRFAGNPAFTESHGTETAPSWSPAPPAAPDWRSEVEVLIQEGKFSEALDQVETRLKSGQDAGACQNFMGVIAMYCGKPDEALGYFGRALDWNPTWDDALKNAFDAALASRNKEALERRVHSALRANPNHAAARNMRRHLEREGESIYAARSFDELEEGAALLEKAETHANEGRALEALQGFLDAVDKRPSNPQALNGLGIIAFAQNRFDDSFKLFEEAARLHSGDQDILMNLWESARALQRERDVLPALEDSLRRNPEFKDLRQALTSLSAKGDSLPSPCL